MAGLDIGMTGAALGGLLSFLSPCVLPLVPAYLCFIAGTSLEELLDGDRDGRAQTQLSRRVAFGAVGFVLGFSTIFIALGASASAIGSLILAYKDVLGRIAGVVIVAFGLHYMGLLRIPALHRDTRFQPGHLGDPSQNLWLQFLSPYVLGLAFAFGWTPCIGPILAAVLTVAASQESLAQGVILLGAYSLGLGIPFLAAAFAIRGFLAFATRFRSHIRRAEFISGLLLAATGLLMLLGSFEKIAVLLLQWFPALATLG
jgi:cytochrome c-type biogenesis protein